MKIRRLSTWANVLFVIFIILLTLSFFFDTPRMYAEEYLGESKAVTGAVYTMLIIVTTVFAPFAGLPLAPSVSIIIGPFLTALYSILGWAIGAYIAFFIARYLARPYLSRFVDTERLERYESYIPETHLFWWLIFLRVVMPVDILSYAIGLTSTIRFPLYAITTAIGIAPFSFIWAYGGNAALERDYFALFIIAAAGLTLFLFSCSFYYARRRRNKNAFLRT